MTERVTVVVVNWNGAHLLAPCLDSLAAQTEPHRVLVVDNASTDGSAEVLARYPAVDVLNLRANTGFAGGAQAGLEKCRTEFVAFLNNDATAEADWLAGLLAPMAADTGVAATTSRILLTADGRINNAGGAVTKWGAGYDRGYGEPDGPPYDVPTDVGFFCGGACALRTSAARVARRISRCRTSCTTRTPTCPGDSAWPAFGSVTPQPLSCITCIPRRRTRVGHLRFLQPAQPVADRATERPGRPGDCLAAAVPGDHRPPSGSTR